jgi:tRNA pseudouridine38-40 synthase
MRAFKATVEYDGTDFAGFQWQHGERTVQGELERAIGMRSGACSRITGAGRTDAGVHALGQVVSFQADTPVPLERMALALNAVLDGDVKVRQVEEVDPAFSARFSASSRQYAYLIVNRRTPSALWRRYSAFCPDLLDVEAMSAAAASLVGERDFAAFTNQRVEGETTMRCVMRCTVSRLHGFVLVRIEANAFLRGMVRTTVGTLLEVGTGRRKPESVQEILSTGDRRLAGPSAPPQGLCLVRVRYGPRYSYTREAPADGPQSRTDM